MHYMPLALPFFLMLFVLFLLLIILIEIGILQYAYEKIGIDRRHMFTLLLLSLLGSYINIPVAELPAEHIHSGRVITFYGMRHVIPMVKEWPRTIIAVNVGGAVVPVILSLYLIFKNRLYARSFIAVGIVTAIVHLMAYPVQGVGIATPTFMPPLVATVAAVLLYQQYAPPLAYIGGSLGTLIGGDLMNLGKIQGLGAPIAAIGGAGTFDGIFVTGILAVLLAGTMPGRPRPS
jgi:uncharacterized membrane protein